MTIGRNSNPLLGTFQRNETLYSYQRIRRESLLPSVKRRRKITVIPIETLKDFNLKLSLQ